MRLVKASINAYAVRQYAGDTLLHHVGAGCDAQGQGKDDGPVSSQRPERVSRRRSGSRPLDDYWSPPGEQDGARPIRASRPRRPPSERRLNDAPLEEYADYGQVDRRRAAPRTRDLRDRRSPREVSRRAMRNLRDGFTGVMQDMTGMARQVRRGVKERKFSWAALKRRRYSGRVVAVLCVLSLVVSFCATQTLLIGVDALLAARDAKQQASAIQAILRDGSFLDTQTLEDLQLRFENLSVDLQRIQAAIPGEGLLANTPGVRGPIHVLYMANDLVNAGQYAVAAALILIPRLKGILKTLGPSGTPTATTAAGAATATPAATPPLGPPPPGSLTLDDVNQAIGDFNIAAGLIQQGVSERSQFTLHDLSKIGLSSLIPTMTKLDAFLPKLPTYMNAAKNIVNELPTILGFTKTQHYLLFDLDSDELRATGGFQGNFGILTFTDGRLIGGVHLHDTTSTLDCVGGCPYRPVPSQFSNWFNVDPNHFGLRDANLDPDFQLASQADETLYTQESGNSVDGVFAMTPALIEQLLTLTGPISVIVPGTQLSVTVNSKNLRDQIHYFHAANNNGGQINSILQTSSQKAIDALLGGAVLKAIGHLSATQQKGLTKVLENALFSHDLQVYFNDLLVENALTVFKLSGAVQAPPGTDTLFVVDTNVGADYANQDVTEQISDTITLDAKGNASHDLKITYGYPVVQHLYSYEWSAWYYTDFLRVILPNSATNTNNPSGCPLPLPAMEANHTVLSCKFVLQRTTSYVNTFTIEYTWTTPNAARQTGGGWEYKLLAQKQAGSHSTIAITIVLPSGAHFTAAPTSPLKASGASQASASLPLSKDLDFIVQYQV